MAEPGSFTVTPDVARAVIGHMNGDHEADNVLICRAFGRDDVVAAELTDVTDSGAVFAVGTPDGPKTVEVAWSEPLADRPAIRHEFVRMYDEACTRLGQTPRPH